MSTTEPFHKRVDNVISELLSGATFGNASFAAAASELGISLKRIHVRDCEQAFLDAVAPVRRAFTQAPETTLDVENLKRAIELLEKLEGILEHGRASPSPSAPAAKVTGRETIDLRSIPHGDLGAIVARYLGADDAATVFRDWNTRGIKLDRPEAGPVDFTGADLKDDILATVVCSMVISRARRVGLDLIKPSYTWSVEQAPALALLGEGERGLLTALRDGSVRTRRGALHISADEGRLRAYCFGRSDSPSAASFFTLDAGEAS